MLQIIIPIKPLHKAKSRLVSVLESHTRESLVVMMLTQVIKASKDALGPGSCTVLGGDKIIEKIVREHQLELEKDAATNLNDSLWVAIRDAQRKGFSATLILPADLPLLMAEDILEIVRASDNYCSHVCSPASSEGGTNAFFQPVEGAIKPMMGLDSFNKHREFIKSLGKKFAVVERDGVGFDLDNKVDYEWASSNIHGWDRDLKSWELWLLSQKELYG